MEKAERWQALLTKLGCIQEGHIVPAQGKRLHLYFGATDVAPRPDRPLHFDNTVVEAHDIHYTGDTMYLLWDDLTSISIR